MKCIMKAAFAVGVTGAFVVASAQQNLALPRWSVLSDAVETRTTSFPFIAVMSPRGTAEPDREDVRASGVRQVASGSTYVPCDSSDARFVCGLSRAEDLVRLAGTPWIVASRFNINLPRPGGSEFEVGFGPLDVVRVDTRDTRRLYPTVDAVADWDRRIYPDCAAPPQPISSLGINVRPVSIGKFQLYVANQGERRSVEVFDVTSNGNDLVTTWRGCISAPHGIIPNAVAPLPNGGVVLSGGGVATWWPSKGWKMIGEIVNGNGVEVSRDGKSLFVSLMGARQVVRVPVEGGAVQTLLRSDFLPDNLRWGEDGGLYVTGMLPPQGFDIFECMQMKVCDIGFAVVRIDPETRATEEVLRSGGIEGVFGAATTSLQVGDHFWIGSGITDRVAVMSSVR